MFFSKDIVKETKNTHEKFNRKYNIICKKKRTLLTWAWIINKILEWSEKIWAERISSLCFSKTKQIAVAKPGFGEEQMLICASTPHTFTVTFEEAHVWKTVGEHIRKEYEEEFAGEIIPKGLVDELWSAKKDSLVLKACVWGEIGEAIVVLVNAP